MADALSFTLMMMVSSVLVFLLSYLYAWAEPRVRHWPEFWASVLIVTCLLPTLGFVFSKLSLFETVIEFEEATFHAPLRAIDIAALEVFKFTPAESFDRGKVLLISTLVIYLLGLFYQSLKLIIGRRKAHLIAKHAVEIKRPDGISVWQTKTLMSPFALTPLGRPKASKIVISSCFLEDLSQAEIQTILDHELAHIDRRDDEMGLVLRCILAVFWFNPAAHWFFEKWKQSAEIQCDAAVTLRHSHDMRRAYAETLIKAFNIVAARIRQYPAASFSNPRLRNAKMRIKSIMNGPEPIFKRTAHKLALLASMAFITLGSSVMISSTAMADPKKTSTEPTATASKNGAKRQRVNDVSFMLTGRFTSPFGQMRDIFKEGKTTSHHGIDIAAPMGTPIYAPADGVIIEATEIYNGMPAYGTVLIIQTEKDLVTFLAHLDSTVVEKGESVKKGQKIATVGSSGKSTAPHVHIETRRNGKRIDPMDVWPFKG